MKNNHIYIDESGNFNNKNVFIICLVILNNIESLKYIELKMNDFKYKYFRDINVELHFNKENFKIKKKFFNVFFIDEFYLRYFKLNKNNNLSNYQYVIQSITENRDITNNSLIFIDGYKSRVYNKNTISKIKKELKSHNINIKSIKYIDSKNSPLIQLADMCAGCIRRKFEKNTIQDNELFNIIEKFIK